MAFPAWCKSTPPSQLSTTNFKHCRFCRPTSVPSVGSSIVSHLQSSSNAFMRILELSDLLRPAAKLYWRGRQKDFKSWRGSGPQQCVIISWHGLFNGPSLQENLRQMEMERATTSEPWLEFWSHHGWHLQKDGTPSLAITLPLYTIYIYIIPVHLIHQVSTSLSP